MKDSKKQNQTLIYTNMVIAGGSMKSLSAIGCITYLEERGLIGSIKNFVGTSAGSIISLFVVLGYTAKEMVRFIVEHINNDNMSTLNVDDIFNVFDTYGLSHGKNIEHFVSAIIHHKLKVKDLSFIELAKNTGRNLVVCVSNITQEREEFWCLESTPLLSVVKAIRTSCSLPILFSPIRHNEDLYIDGGLFNNFPIDYFKGDSPLKDIIGINISATSPKDTNDFMQYIALILNIVTKQLTKSYKNDIQNNVVTLELEDEGWISLNDMKINVSKEILERYIYAGYVKMKDMIEKHEQLTINTLTSNSLQSE